MRWIVVLLLTVVGGFMTFDGVRAMTVGDYLTPSSGEYAGQLGPWSHVVEGVGVPARSTGMKATFVAIGIFHLVAVVTLIIGRDAPASWIVVVAAIAGLWYLPLGTVADLAVLAIVALSSLRPWGLG